MATPNWGWTDRASCQGEDLVLFFGPDGEKAVQAIVREQRAIAFCERYCRVRQACLDWALALGETGVWGGTNDDQRKAIKRRKQRAAARAAV